MFGIMFGNFVNCTQNDNHGSDSLVFFLVVEVVVVKIENYSGGHCSGVLMHDILIVQIIGIRRDTSHSTVCLSTSTYNMHRSFKAKKSCTKALPTNAHFIISMRFAF